MKEHRPWGYFEILSDEPDHKVKRILVLPGQRLSLQRHSRRSEHWFIIQGQATMTLDKAEFGLQKGQAVDIPTGSFHRIANKGMEDVVFIEVQTGDYFGENDIERKDDDYGRTDITK